MRASSPPAPADCGGLRPSLPTAAPGRRPLSCRCRRRAAPPAGRSAEGSARPAMKSRKRRSIGPEGETARRYVLYPLAGSPTEPIGPLNGRHLGVPSISLWLARGAGVKAILDLAVVSKLLHARPKSRIEDHRWCVAHFHHSDDGVRASGWEVRAESRSGRPALDFEATRAARGKDSVHGQGEGFGRARIASPAPFLVVGMGLRRWPGGVLQAGQEYLGRHAAGAVLVQHLLPTTRPTCDRFCEARPRFPSTKRPSDEAEPGHIYVIPADARMAVVDGRLQVGHRPTDCNQIPPSIDLFESLASGYREHAVAVVLSGMASDGAAGLAAVKAAGGSPWSEDRGGEVRRDAAGGDRHRRGGPGPPGRAHGGGADRLSRLPLRPVLLGAATPGLAPDGEHQPTADLRQLLQILRKTKRRRLHTLQRAHHDAANLPADGPPADRRPPAYVAFLRGRSQGSGGPPTKTSSFTSPASFGSPKRSRPRQRRCSPACSPRTPTAPSAPGFRAARRARRSTRWPSRCRSPWAMGPTVRRSRSSGPT